MYGITVRQLKQFCEEQIKRGNEDKVVQITRDDEGNGYHTLFYGFDDDIDEIIACDENEMFHDKIDVTGVVLLG